MNYYQPRGTFDNRLNTINQQYGLQTPMYNQTQPMPMQQPVPNQQMPMPNQQMNQTPYGNSVIPVGGIEEVKAYPIDFTGGITYFNDVTNSKIYSKQLGLNGAPEIKVYSLDNSPFDNSSKTNEVVEQQYNSLAKRIEDVERKIFNYEKSIGGFNNESNATISNDVSKTNEPTTTI